MKEFKNYRYLYLVNALRLKTRCHDGIYSVMGLLCNRYSPDLVSAGIDAMPLMHPNPIGYLVEYCKKMADETTIKKNEKLKIKKIL